MAFVSRSRHGFLKRKRSGRRRYTRRRRRNKRISQFFLLLVIFGGIYTIGFWQPWNRPSPDTLATELPAAAQTVPPPARKTPTRRAILNEKITPPKLEPALAATNTRASRSTPQTIQMGTPPQHSGSDALQSALKTPATQIQPIPVASNYIPASTRTPRPTNTASGSVQDLLIRASEALNRNSHVEARSIFNRVLLHPAASNMDRDLARDQLTSIAQLLTFSPTVMEDDPLVMRYTVRSGDSLSKIAAQNDLQTDWRFIARVNKINDPRRIRVGQTLKLVKGPFHAEISKSNYRLDLWAELPTDAGGGRVFIASFPVGLGEFNSTPNGTWKVRSNSRLINPPWTNPRTGEYFSADNPENPIGERWIGLQGTDQNTSVISGIGIHGTIAPSSIGTQSSMGCIRMHDQDVRVLYELLAESSSTVSITP